MNYNHFQFYLVDRLVSKLNMHLTDSTSTNSISPHFKRISIRSFVLESLLFMRNLQTQKLFIHPPEYSRRLQILASQRPLVALTMQKSRPACRFCPQIFQSLPSTGCLRVRVDYYYTNFPLREKRQDVFLPIIE